MLGKGEEREGDDQECGGGAPFRTTLETDCHGKHPSMYLITADTDGMAHNPSVSLCTFMPLYRAFLERALKPQFSKGRQVWKRKRGVSK